jgi:hypothetical protein
MAHENKLKYVGNGIWRDPENGDYVTQDGESWLGFEDAQAHMDENYWSQEELPLQNVIDDLKGLKVENFGVLPEYLTSPIDNRGWSDRNFDLFDSSTWNVPTNIEDRTYVGAPGVTVPGGRGRPPIDEREVLEEIGQITDPIERDLRLDKFEQLLLDQEIAYEQDDKSMIDVLAEDNPEIRTGFFPRRYYPESSTSNLTDYLRTGKRIRKTGISEEAAGHYSDRPDEIAVRPVDGGLPSHQRLLEIMGHEGLHYAYPFNYVTPQGDAYERRGFDALELTMPWPGNWSNPILAGNTPKAAGHEAMLNMDKMFFPEGMRNIEYRNLNRKGVENLNAIMNWQKDPPWMEGKANEQPTWMGQGNTAREVGIANIPQRTSNIPQRRRPNPHQDFSTGGLVSLML